MSRPGPHTYLEEPRRLGYLRGGEGRVGLLPTERAPEVTRLAALLDLNLIVMIIRVCVCVCVGGRGHVSVSQHDKIKQETRQDKTR